MLTYALSPKRVRDGCKNFGLSRHILKSDVSKAKKSEHGAGYSSKRPSGGTYECDDDNDITLEEPQKAVMMIKIISKGLLHTKIISGTTHFCSFSFYLFTLDEETECSKKKVCTYF